MGVEARRRGIDKQRDLPPQPLRRHGDEALFKAEQNDAVDRREQGPRQHADVVGPIIRQQLAERLVHQREGLNNQMRFFLVAQRKFLNIVHFSFIQGVAQAYKTHDTSKPVLTDALGTLLCYRKLKPPFNTCHGSDR